MGWFQRSSRAPEPESASPGARHEATGINFERYQLDELGADVRSIVDVPGAIAGTLKWALTLPFVVAIVVWAVFSSRMATWVLVPFSLVTFVLAGVASAAIGGYFVARRRLDAVSEAADRVVSTVGEMHADVVRVKEGELDTSVKELAVGLLETAIFPAVFGSVTTAAEQTAGRLGAVAARAARGPLQLVQRSVVSAVESLPDRRLGQAVDDADAALPATAAMLEDLNGTYRAASDRLDGIVGRVSSAALGSMLGVVVVSAAPLAVWLLLGWLLS